MRCNILKFNNFKVLYTNRLRARASPPSLSPAHNYLARAQKIKWPVFLAIRVLIAS